MVWFRTVLEQCTQQSLFQLYRMLWGVTSDCMYLWLQSVLKKNPSTRRQSMLKHRRHFMQYARSPLSNYYSAIKKLATKTMLGIMRSCFVFIGNFTESDHKQYASDLVVGEAVVYFISAFLICYLRLLGRCLPLISMTPRTTSRQSLLYLPALYCGMHLRISHLHIG